MKNNVLFLRVSVELSIITKGIGPATYSVAPSLIKAMGSLLDNPEFSDIIFLVYKSPHQGRKRGCRLHKIYANKQILSSRSEYFRSMFEGDFKEGAMRYSSDDDSKDWRKETMRDVAETSPNLSPNGFADPEKSKEIHLHKDMLEAILEDSDNEYEEEDEDFINSPQLANDEEAKQTSKEDSPCMTDSLSITQQGIEENPKISQRSDSRRRHIVVVEDCVYSTFKALLYYLYTGTIDFAPLTSLFLDNNASNVELSGLPSDESIHNTASLAQEVCLAHKQRQLFNKKQALSHIEGGGQCSAKSMYCLADKIGLPDLQLKAENHIVENLEVRNIAWEVFSRFTMRYEKICKLETDFLFKHWEEAKETRAMRKVLPYRVDPVLAQSESICVRFE